MKHRAFKNLCEVIPKLDLEKSLPPPPTQLINQNIVNVPQLNMDNNGAVLITRVGTDEGGGVYCTLVTLTLRGVNKQPTAHFYVP